MKEVEPLFTAVEWSEMREHETTLETLHVLALYKALATGQERKTAAVSLLASVDKFKKEALRSGPEEPGYLFALVSLRIKAQDLSKHLGDSDDCRELRRVLE